MRARACVACRSRHRLRPAVAVAVFACLVALVAARPTLAQFACVELRPENAHERAFYEAVRRLSQASAARYRDRGIVFDICFDRGPGRTRFFARGKRAGIRLSMEDLNEAYRLVAREDPWLASMTNVFILLHERAHARAHLDLNLDRISRADAGSPGKASRFAEVMSLPGPLRPLLRRWWRALPAATRRVKADGFAGEAYADCIAGAEISEFRRTERPGLTGLLRNDRLGRAVLTRAIEAAASVHELDRVHGTAEERASYVTYGWQARDVYGDSLGARAGVDVLCIMAAVAAASDHAAGRPAPMHAFEPARGY